MVSSPRCVLALESGGMTSSVALSGARGELMYRMADSGQSHSSQLLPMAQTLLAQAGMVLSDVDGIVVGIGPGSFTGLRIAVGLVQGIALGARKPVAGIHGFDLWAYIWWTANRHGSAGVSRHGVDLSISFDARLGERFNAQLRWIPDATHIQIERLHAPMVVSAQDPTDGHHVTLVDPTCADLGAEDLPLAAWMARYAIDPQCAHHHTWQHPRALRPLYVRDKVAQTTAEREGSPDLAWSPMSERDIASVMVIEQQAYAFPWTSGNFLDSLRAGYPLRILKENGVMIGYVAWMAAVDEAHLLNLTLSPARQGRGLGSWMMQQFMDQVHAAGFDRILLEVRPSNHAAIGLYRKFGFEEIGRRHGYYPNSGTPGVSREDAIVMRHVRLHREVTR